MFTLNADDKAHARRSTTLSNEPPESAPLDRPLPIAEGKPFTAIWG